jgi:phage terminase small subunit
LAKETQETRRPRLKFDDLEWPEEVAGSALAAAANAPLRPRQKRFVEEYLVDLNATQAAIRAGYSKKHAGDQGYDLLRRANVVAAVQLALAERSRRTAITADKVLVELARIAFADLRDCVDWDDTGATLKESKELTTDTARAVAEVTVTRGKSGEKIRVKLHDKMAALTALARHLGLFKDRIEITGPAGEPPVVLNVFVDRESPPAP